MAKIKVQINTMKERLLSICIPTKNRQDYCLYAIKTILENNENFELIVHDNSDEDTLREMIDDIEDSRLKYYYSDKSLDAVDFMIQNNIDSLITSYIPAYKWPSAPNENDGLLKIVKKRVNSNIEYPNIDKSIKKLFENGLIDYQKYNLPRLYHGIIGRGALEKIKNKIGSYFSGLSSDIYSTIALSTVVKKHVIINYPISIAGACPQSAIMKIIIGTS